jgi:hypothetical protein
MTYTREVIPPNKQMTAREAFDRLIIPAIADLEAEPHANHENDHGTYNSADQAGALARAVPPQSLTHPSSDECTHDPKDGRQMKPEGSFLPGVMNFAITPATNPMIIVQMISTVLSCSGAGDSAAPQGRGNLR